MCIRDRSATAQRVLCALSLAALAEAELRLRTRSGDPTDQECNFAKRTQLTHAKSGGCHCTYPKHDSITLSLILCVCVAMVPSTAGELRRQIPEFLKRLQYGSHLSSTTIEPSSYRNRQRNRPSLTGSHWYRFDYRTRRDSVESD